MEYGLVVLWLATYLVFGLAALPLTAALFPRFPDRGAAFAIPVGLATLGLVAFAVGHIAFGWPALVVGVLVLLAGSYRVGDRAGVSERGYAEVAGVFTVAFLLAVAIRAVDPAIAPLPLATGEKFLDYGLVNTLLRAETLPPEDMWFAGESVQYYYGGHLLAALLSTFTQTPARFAYNLALAGFYAALVTAAYGLAGAIADAHGAPRRVAGGIGAFFVGIASNLQPAAQVLLWVLPRNVVARLTGLPPDHEWLLWTPAEFSYWTASRVIQYEVGDRTYQTINEFPLFAWLNGDLHAHMMSTPFTLLVAALCFSYWLTPAAERWRRRGLLVAITPIAGLQVVVNTWSFPTAAGLAVLTVAFAPADPATLLPARWAARVPARTGWLEELRRDGLAALVGIGVLAVGAVWASPFLLASATGRGLGFFPPQSPLGPLLLVHGGFLLVFGPYLAQRIGHAADRPLRIGLWALVVGLLCWVVGLAGLALFGPLVVLTWYVLRQRADAGFETVLILGGLGLALLVEFVHVLEPQYQGTGLERLNTVFKTYMQVWILWAPAAGVVLARFLRVDSMELPLVDPDAVRAFGVMVTALVLFSTALYAGFALPAHLSQSPVGADGPTLDGETYLSQQYPGETAAIAWVDDREGQPTIVTQAPGGYRWNPEEGLGASAPASLTGVPTVLGWFHEEQYRGTALYRERLEAVATIYEGSEAEQSALLAAYEVEYVYVGPAERAAYDGLSIDEHPALEPVHESGAVVIYQVDHGDLQ